MPFLGHFVTSPEVDEQAIRIEQLQSQHPLFTGNSDILKNVSFLLSSKGNFQLFLKQNKDPDSQVHLSTTTNPEIVTQVYMIKPFLFVKVIKSLKAP